MERDFSNSAYGPGEQSLSAWPAALLLCLFISVMCSFPFPEKRITVFSAGMTADAGWVPVRLRDIRSGFCIIAAREKESQTGPGAHGFRHFPRCFFSEASLNAGVILS